MNHIFDQITAERKRQDEKWGEQNHPMVGKREYPITDRVNHLIPYPSDKELVVMLKKTRIRNENKNCGWFDILMEEVYEAFAESDPAKARAEMIQVCAIGVAIVEYLDRQIEGGKG